MSSLDAMDARDWYAVLHGLRTNATDYDRDRAIAAARRLTGQAREHLAGQTADQVAGLLTELQEALDFAAEPDEYEHRFVDWPGRPVQLAILKGGLL